MREALIQIFQQYFINPLWYLYIGVSEWPEEEENRTPPQK